MKGFTGLNTYQNAIKQYYSGYALVRPKRSHPVSPVTSMSPEVQELNKPMTLIRVNPKEQMVNIYTDNDKHFGKETNRLSSLLLPMETVAKQDSAYSYGHTAQGMMLS